MRVFYALAAMYGLFRLYLWVQSAEKMLVDLLVALFFLSLGSVFLFNASQERFVTLVLRYLLGLLLLGIAAYWEPTVLMWGMGLFVLIFALVDTIFER